MALTLADIVDLFEQRGNQVYGGEPVTQLQHALQAALLAEQADAGDALITAALLHDLGHLLHELGASPAMQGVDDVHQYRALPFLRGVFPDTVLEPIRLHVDAKRYLCATREGYSQSLAADSVRSLALQGGTYSDAEARTFIGRPHADASVQLRVWDDLAKRKDLPTPPLSHYMRIARRCAS